MFLSMISMAFCVTLVVRLLFWTDEHRRESRWYYRVLLFLVTIYAGSQVVNFLYHPTVPVSFMTAMFHLALLYGAFIIKPHHFPWNGHHDTASKAVGTTGDTASRLRYGLRSEVVRCGKARAQEREHGAHSSPQRFH